MLRIRLPRKTQRRCRSALHRRARSEPPKSQRATTRSNLFSTQQTGETVKSYDINPEQRECTPDLPALNIPVDVLKQANGEDDPPVFSDLSAREPDSLANQLTDKESGRSTGRRSSTTDVYKVKESEGEESLMSSRRSVKQEKSSRSKEDGSGSERRSSRSVRTSGKETNRSKESSRKSNKESSRSARPTSARNSARSITSKKNERSSARNSESGSARSSGRSNVTERRLSKEPSVAEVPVAESEIPSPPQLSQIHPIDESEDVSIKSSSLPVPAVRKKSLNYKRSPICD